ncbi:YihY/virulence factor BrkB family protein [Synechococcus sp. BIOS-E4-1]|uniref:YihY/virulence factor BrkB family protein n=1 Tax=Synechococcus sp. BIOS-E4-1 TaxID=1400864 RepID=UPI001646D7FD|nr:YihY/virulence factor BrkB family protein [Synechococcus sp. BIOS-E4-1]
MAKMLSIRQLCRSLWRAYLRWASSDCVDLSAAFAYYTLQSIFPILLISLSLTSWLLGRQQNLDEQILIYASGVLPPPAIEIIRQTLQKLVSQGFGAGLLGAAVLLVTAGNVYLTLQRGADRLWRDVLQPLPDALPFGAQAYRFVRVRIEAFFVVILIGLLIVVDQISANLRMVPAAFVDELTRSLPWLTDIFPDLPVLQFGRLLIPFMGFSGMALLLQFLLPSRKVPFLPLIPGSLLIGFLLTVLNLAVSRSIFSLGARYQAYGVIGGVLVLTLWIWMVGVVIYFGQCWSVELANMRIKKSGDPFFHAVQD